MILLAILVMGATWFMVTRIARLSHSYTASERARNAVVLKTAKEALIGYVAVQAAQAGENNPGRLPCPEAPGYIGGANEGQAAGACTLPAVGRLPWRTLGLDRLVDAHGEPLWYVVSPGWAYTASNLVINSDSVGQLAVDGRPNAAVALIVAPGAPMNVAASTGCAARNQFARGAPSTTINALDYAECFDTATAAFSTTGPASSFNDQAVMVSAADVMPGIEAAVAARIQREVAPVLTSVYATSQWGLSSTNPLFPYPASFANPGSSTYVGTSATTAGLLPVNSQTCSLDPRCLTIVAWRTPIVASVTQTGGTGSLQVGTTCSLITPTQARCQGNYLALGPTQLRMSVRADNVAMGFRDLDPSAVSAEYLTLLFGWQSVALDSFSGAFVSDGSANIRAVATMPSLLALTITFRITIDIAALTDHAVLNPNDATTGWFMRNEWYRLLYYVPAPRHTAGGGALPAPSCTTGSTCLNVANVTPAGAQRAILILAGRSINASARPSANLADYLELGNLPVSTNPLLNPWQQQKATSVPATSYGDTGTPDAYIVSAASVAIGAPLQFRAANTNTGPSTLTTSATGTKSLVNLDLSALAASQIRAYAPIQVVYDGTRFILQPRPINDRIIVMDAN